jgi:hypothetical protein
MVETVVIGVAVVDTATVTGVVEITGADVPVVITETMVVDVPVETMAADTVKVETMAVVMEIMGTIN